MKNPQCDRQNTRAANGLLVLMLSIGIAAVGIAGCDAGADQPGTNSASDGVGTLSAALTSDACSPPFGNHNLKKQPKWFLDADGDGFGDPWCAHPSNGNRAPEGAVDNGDDCDDSDAAVSPAAEEVCGDDIDNNCNGVVGQEIADSSPGECTGCIAGTSGSCQNPIGKCRMPKGDYCPGKFKACVQTVIFCSDVDPS